MTLKYILGGIAIITSYLAGNLYANKIKRNLLELETLHNALILLKTQICAYSSGLTYSLKYVNEHINCRLFVDMENGLLNETSPKSVILNCNVPSQLKSSLTGLFECILFNDENDISKAFLSTLEVVDLYKKNLSEQYDKEAPLYRKLGLLLGISIFILLL